MNREENKDYHRENEFNKELAGCISTPLPLQPGRVEIEGAGLLQVESIPVIAEQDLHPRWLNA